MINRLNSMLNEASYPDRGHDRWITPAGVCLIMIAILLITLIVMAICSQL